MFKPKPEFNRNKLISLCDFARKYPTFDELSLRSHYRGHAKSELLNAFYKIGCRIFIDEDHFFKLVEDGRMSSQPTGISPNTKEK